MGNKVTKPLDVDEFVNRFEKGERQLNVLLGVSPRDIRKEDDYILHVRGTGVRFFNYHSQPIMLCNVLTKDKQIMPHLNKLHDIRKQRYNIYSMIINIIFSHRDDILPCVA